MNVLLELYYNKRIDSDITIVVCGEEFKSHKNILRYASPVLSALFDFPGNEDKDWFDLSERDEQIVKENENNESCEKESTAMIEDLYSFKLLFKIWYGVELHFSKIVIGHTLERALGVYKLCRLLQCEYPKFSSDHKIIWVNARDQHIQICKQWFVTDSREKYPITVVQDSFCVVVENETKPLESYLNELVGENLFASIRELVRVQKFFELEKCRVFVNNSFWFESMDSSSIDIFDLIMKTFSNTYPIQKSQE